MRSSINTIDSQEVFNFKEKYCNENRIIADILRRELHDFLISPVLDVGAGTGDIAFNSLQDFDVTLLDVNPPSAFELKCRGNHKRITGDFFDFTSSAKVGTLLIAHTLQFLDEDIIRLNQKIKDIDAKRIALIVNANDGFLRKIIDWVDLHFLYSNPERHINGFPQGYDLLKSVPFTATLKCPTFEILADQISYLMLIDLAEKRESLVNHLKTQLLQPKFTIRQYIYIYTQHHE